MSADERLQPMRWIGSILFFGIPALIFAWFILWLGPWMMRHGHGQLLTFTVAYGGPLLLLTIAAFVVYRLEGHPWSWPAFRDRMRLHAPTGRAWVWTLGIIAVSIVGTMLVAQVAQLFAGIQLFVPAAEFYELRGGIADGTFGGLETRGRWDLFLLMFVIFVVLNIGGEELWWRGIALPRQELAFGRWAWLVNGLLWNLFHAFYHTSPASMIGYLVPTLSLAFLAQRTGNTWPAIVFHCFMNRGAWSVFEPILR